MVYVQQNIRCADSSGARWVRIIRILRKGNPKAPGRVGDQVIVAVKRATPNKKVKKSEVHKAIIIRNGSLVRRKNGLHVQFFRGAVVIAHKKTAKLPFAKRVFGPVPRELREKGFIKVVSLASICV